MRKTLLSAFIVLALSATVFAGGHRSGSHRSKNSYRPNIRPSVVQMHHGHSFHYGSHYSQNYRHGHIMNNRYQNGPQRYCQNGPRRYCHRSRMTHYRPFVANRSRARHGFQLHIRIGR